MVSMRRFLVGSKHADHDVRLYSCIVVHGTVGIPQIIRCCSFSFPSFVGSASSTCISGFTPCRPENAEKGTLSRSTGVEKAPGNDTCTCTSLLEALSAIRKSTGRKR